MKGTRATGSRSAPLALWPAVSAPAAAHKRDEVEPLLANGLSGCMQNGSEPCPRVCVCSCVCVCVASRARCGVGLWERGVPVDEIFRRAAPD